MHPLTIYKAKKHPEGLGLVIDFDCRSEHAGPLRVHVLSGYNRPGRKLREEYFAALEVHCSRCCFRACFKTPLAGFDVAHWVAAAGGCSQAGHQRSVFAGKTRPIKRSQFD